MGLFSPLILLCPSIYLVTYLGFFIGVEITSFHLIAGFFTSLVFSKYLLKESNRSTVLGGLAALLLVGVAFFLNHYFLDIFYDSGKYHFRAISYLTQGWNPFYTVDPCDVIPSDACSNTPIYVVHYPKSYWVIAASFYKFFNTMLATYIQNIVLMASVFALLLTFVKKITKLAMLPCVLIALVWALNPTSVWELFSNYVDGAHVAGLSLVLMSALLFIKTNEKRWLYVSLMYMPIVANVKFTGFIYVMVLGLGQLVFAFKFANRDTFKMLLKTSIPVLIGSILLFGSNPYVSNIISHENPFYPVVNMDDSRDIIEGQADAEFIKKSRFEKLFISTFSISKGAKNPPVFELPFSRVNFWPRVSTRYSGNGPWFSGVLLIALLLLPVLNYQALFLLSIVFVSTLATSAGWYTRLTPQFWWLPVMIIMFAMTQSFSRKVSWIKPKLIHFVSMGCLILLLVNSAIVGAFVYRKQFMVTKQFKDFIQKSNHELSVKIKDTRFTPYSLTLLNEAGSKVTLVDSCPTGAKELEVLKSIEICETFQ